MSKEQRVVAIAILTVLLYAFGLWLDSDFFLLPFPLFDLIFLLVFIRFLTWNTQLRGTYIWVYFLAALLQVLYNPLILGMIGNDIQLERLDESMYIDAMKLASKFLLLVSLVFWRTERKVRFSLWLVPMIAFFLTMGLVETFFWVTPVAPFLCAVILRKYDADNPYRYLWFLQGVFDLFTVSMLFYTIL